MWCGKTSNRSTLTVELEVALITFALEIGRPETLRVRYALFSLSTRLANMYSDTAHASGQKKAYMCTSTHTHTQLLCDSSIRRRESTLLKPAYAIEIHVDTYVHLYN